MRLNIYNICMYVTIIIKVKGDHLFERRHGRKGKEGILGEVGGRKGRGIVYLYFNYKYVLKK